MADKVSLDDEAGRAAGPGVGWGQALVLFCLYLVVVSDYFTHSVVGAIPGAVEGRETTSRGEVAKGVILVVAYVVILHLYRRGA